jgi:pimeloyl-CoA dehydrogenase small subunit
MDFDLSEEQRLLKESVDRLVDDLYGNFEKRRAAQAEPGGWSAAAWSSFAELGLLGLPFEERDGGYGGGPIETMLVMEALGRGLAPEPYLATVVAAGGVIRRAANETVRAELVSAIGEGRLVLALAQMEPQSRYDLGHVATTARWSGDAWILDGTKSVVLHGGSAHKLIVSARTSGSEHNPEGISLFLVDADADGVMRRDYALQDGTRAADIHFDQVAVRASGPLGPAGVALPILEDVVDEAAVALCAEAIGAMEALHLMTVDYLKTRRQFGVPIGSFQVLQHRAADMMIALEQARSMSYYAAMMLGEDRDERRSAVAAAKVQINRSARFIGQEAVQLHGGIGMTLEYKAAHLFKRLTMIEQQFGDNAHHLGLLMRSAA